MFRSDLLEHMTMISPRSFALIWAVLIPFIAWMGWGAVDAGTWIGLVLLGLLTWSIFEYAMHRFIFHWELRSELGRWWTFVIHGNHHHDPNDSHRSLMPPIVSVTWGGAIWAALVLLARQPGSVVFLGFIIGYVTYDGIHYACHQLPVRGPLMRKLRRHHLRHHFGRQEGNYAITAIFWDRVFGSHLSSKASSSIRARD
ncbi:sterol desaturase family protein [Sphingomonas gellani]|uniref:sterol desaturase family protein n=1 Tax=Sphingomonas gellani TaxID=1166340 RepID=UPI001FCCE199|nr:sterol desaturase family protein [Sphingomonas gellani]